MHTNSIIRTLFYAGCLVGILHFTAQAQVVAVRPQSQTIMQGDTVVVRVQAEDFTGLKVYSIKLSYQRQFLRCISVAKLEFLSGPFSTFFISKVDSINGTVQCDEAILGTGSSTGTGGLFEIKFVGLSAGISPMNLISLDLRDIANQQLLYTSSNGSVEVQTTAVTGWNTVHDKDYILYANYPNPFNPGTKIMFSLPERSTVNLEVFSMLGEKVTTLVNAELSAGTHEVNFNASHLSSGTYLCRLTAGATVRVIKMNVVK